jgi:hypothetical protein
VRPPPSRAPTTAGVDLTSVRLPRPTPDGAVLIGWVMAAGTTCLALAAGTRSMRRLSTWNTREPGGGPRGSPTVRRALNPPDDGLFAQVEVVFHGSEIVTTSFALSKGEC